MPEKSLSYKEAGVDIDAGNQLVEMIKPSVHSTFRPEVLTGIGGFGGLFQFDNAQITDPVLVSGTDGVGTKLKLAQQLEDHTTIGIDLVAMCVNDVLTSGAEPLFFLDYFATGKLNIDTAAEVIEGIAEGCRQSGCALIGGETAEMPDMYAPGEYDLAGFVVGVVDRGQILDGSAVREGDSLIGIGSSGPHSNGFSLIRKILSREDASLDLPLAETTLGAALLAPTTIYVKPVLELLKAHQVHAMSHITGGGIVENIIRVVPDGLGIVVDPETWPAPPIFDWLQAKGNVEKMEMLRTFNCGIGLCLICPTNQATVIHQFLDGLELPSWTIGKVVSAPASGNRVTILGL